MIKNLYHWKYFVLVLHFLIQLLEVSIMKEIDRFSTKFVNDIVETNYSENIYSVLSSGWTEWAPPTRKNRVVAYFEVVRVSAAHPKNET